MNDAATAAIEFALITDDGIEFLRLWNVGEFDAIREEWPEAPAAVFIGADPLLPSEQLGDKSNPQKPVAHLKESRQHKGVYLPCHADDLGGFPVYRQQLDKDKLAKWLKAQAYAKESVHWPDGDGSDFCRLEELIKYLPEYLAGEFED